MKHHHKIDRSGWDAEMLEVQHFIESGQGDTPRMCWRCGAEGSIRQVGSGIFKCSCCKRRISGR